MWGGNILSATVTRVVLGGSIISTKLSIKDLVVDGRLGICSSVSEEVVNVSDKVILGAECLLRFSSALIGGCVFGDPRLVMSIDFVILIEIVFFFGGTMFISISDGAFRIVVILF